MTLTAREKLAYDELVECRKKLVALGNPAKSIDDVLTALEPPPARNAIIPDWQDLPQEARKSFNKLMDDGIVKNNADIYRLVRDITSVPV